MAAIDFPNTPTVGETFASGGRTWQWDGTAWNLVATAAVAESGFNPFLLMGA